MIYSREIRIVLHIIDSVVCRYPTDALFSCNANVAIAIKTSGVNVALPPGERDHILAGLSSPWISMFVHVPTHTYHVEILV